jgi:hypothetical protein
MSAPAADTQSILNPCRFRGIRDVLEGSWQATAKPESPMLRAIAVLIVASVATLLLYAAGRPDTFRVDRSVSIHAPAEKIFPLINDLRAWRFWSPYENLDPAMHRAFSGAAAGPGAVYQ